MDDSSNFTRLGFGAIFVIMLLKIKLALRKAH